jgi:hypothetical protein
LPQPLPRALPGATDGFHNRRRSVPDEQHRRGIKPGRQGQESSQERRRPGPYAPPPIPNGGMWQCQVLSDGPSTDPRCRVVERVSNHLNDVKPTNQKEGWKQGVGSPTVPTAATPNPDAVVSPLVGAHPAPVPAPADQAELTARTALGWDFNRSSVRGITGRGEGAWPYD